MDRELFIVTVLPAPVIAAEERAAGGTGVVQAAVERACTVGRRNGPARDVQRGRGQDSRRWPSVNRPLCTVAPPLTVFWAYQVLLPVTVKLPPMASVPATPPLERVTLLLTWPLPKSRPP